MGRPHDSAGRIDPAIRLGACPGPPDFREDTMTPQQKMLVRTTFAQVLPIAETAAALFYARLFELDPSLRPLFTSDLQEQGRKLMQMLAAAVRGLDDLETLVPAVRALGKRHG